MVYAVIDTNIIVSAMITHNSDAATVKVLESLFTHRFTPLYNDEIISEYEEVLHRTKFMLAEEPIRTVIDYVKTNGIVSSRFPYEGEMPDEDDRMLYEVALSEESALLVTGNQKHFPHTPKVVTAAEFLMILDR
jgi:uncharacterized protein